MESLDNTNSVSGFIKHVFNFDGESKADMLNIVQYTLLALLPIVGINKTMQKYVPEADENKGNVELVLEVVLQSVIMFLGILFIHRIVDYVPTYSGVKYPEFRVTYIILAVLMITLSLQTKLGEKVNILTVRLSDAWNGTSPQPVKKGGNVKVSQPISQGGQGPPPQQQMTHSQSAINHAMGGDTQSVGGTTNINNLPTSDQIPNYTNMYQDTPNPLQNANVPGGGATAEGFGGMNEPVAASEVGGFGGFSLF